jgi:ribokinase
MKFDVVTIGGASQDVYLQGEAMRATHDVRTKDEVTKFPLGEKIELDEIYFETGGGATNGAATFARQGLKTAFMGMIGDDPAGENVVKALNKEKIDTEFVVLHKKYHTMYSTFLLDPSGERTILIYRGATFDMKARDLDIKNIDAKWLYITSLAGDFELLEALLDHAVTHNIKVAIDPGAKELEQAERMKKLLPKLELIKGNKEELSQLVTHSKDPKVVLRELAAIVPYVMVTDGPKGSYATDGSEVIQAGMYEDVPVIDRTGAGDAFGSGFVAKVIQGASLEEAVIFGSANSTSVVQLIGSKPGILRKNAKLHSMDLKISSF